MTTKKNRPGTNGAASQEEESRRDQGSGQSRLDQRRFLELLYTDAHGRCLEGYVDLRAIEPDGPGVKRASVKLRSTDADGSLADVEGAIRRLEREYPGYNVYIGVATRTKRGAGGKEDLHSTQVIFSEIDRYGEGASGKDLATIDLLYFPPSMVVASGGGEHLYWRLEEPLDLRQPENLERYEAILRGITHAIGGDRKATDASRILRPVDTTNYPDEKKRLAGRTTTKEVLLTRADAGALHSFGDFAEFEEIGRGLKSTSGSGSGSQPTYERRPWTEDAPPPRVAEILAAHPRVRERYERNADGLDDPSDSGVDWRLGQDLVRLLGLGSDTGSEVEATLRLSRDLHGAAKNSEAKGDGYFVRTVEKLLAWWAKERPTDPREAFGAQPGGAQDSGGSAPHFKLNQFNKPSAGNRENMALALGALGVELSYDEFADRLLVRRGDEPAGQHLTDNALIKLRWDIDKAFGFRPPKDDFADFAVWLALQHSFHPVRDYLDGLVWDGVPRIDTWIGTYGGAEDSAYVRAIASIVLIAAVRRVRRPGCKFDEILVLESKQQGTDKSSAVKKLCPCEEWYTDDLPIGVDSQKVIERTNGMWIIEAAELSGMRKSEVEKVKAFSSRGVDRARAAWGHFTQERPRQFVMIGTTNSDAYLKDSTGNRRFWPVKVTGFDLAAISRDRDQLWAEAADREAAGESIRLDKTLWEAAGVEQEARRVADAWEGVLEDQLGAADDPDRLDGKILAEDVWALVGKADPATRGQHDNERLGTAIRALGFDRDLLRFDGKPRRCYVRRPKDDVEQTQDLDRIAVVRECDKTGRVVRAYVWMEGQTAEEPSDSDS